MEAAVELEGNAPEAQKLREKREKERQKERAKVEKEKEYDDGKLHELYFKLPIFYRSTYSLEAKMLYSSISIIISETIKVYDGYSSLRKRLFRTVTVSKQASKEDLLVAAMRAFVVTQDRCNFYLLDVYANCDCDRDTEIEDPLPVQK